MHIRYSSITSVKFNISWIILTQTICFRIATATGFFVVDVLYHRKVTLYLKFLKGGH